MSAGIGEPTEGIRNEPGVADPLRAKRGFEEYRAHVGPAEFYDVLTAIQFNLLTALGLRDEHYLLDIGCGSLRAGRLFIPYLRPGHYFGIEPLPWLIEEGIAREIGDAMIAIKRPTFSNDENFTLTTFNRQFDFMIAQSIFSHTSQAQIRRCLAEAKTALGPGGIFAATYFVGPVNYEGDRWVAKADYTPEHMRELVEEQGLVCTPVEWRHPDPQQWILIHHPGTSVPLAEASDAQRIVTLREQLALCERQLMTLRSHPYVRLGLKIKLFFVWVAFQRRHIARRLRGLVGGAKK